tara:strand:- start:2388 stop:2834 length:447 start_codon:yes stop_codon:yes gene_type:complete
MNFKTFDSALAKFYDLMVYHRADVKTKWSLGSYDGPAAGIVEYNNKLYLAMSPLDHEHSPRIFLIIDIGEDRIKSLLEYMEKRYLTFGNCKYNDDGTRDKSKDRDHMTKEFREIATKFHKETKMPDYYPDDNDEIVGWFRNWKLAPWR